MAKKTFGISKVFLRFFLSFLAVLLIPLLILGTISRKTIRSIMQNSELQRKTAALYQCGESIGNELDNIYTIAFKASVEQEFSPFIMSDFTRNSLTVISRLRSYKTANSFIHEIYLASPYSDYIYSAGTTYSYERFSTQKMPGETSRADLFTVLSGVCENTQYGYTPSSNESTFFLVYPLPLHEAGNYAYMIFEIPKNAFKSHFNAVIDPDASSLMVLDGNDLIASFDHYSEPMRQQIMSGMEKALKNGKSGYLDTEPDLAPLFYFTDEHTGLSYVLSLPETDTMAAVNQVINLFTFYLLLLLFIGSIAIFILAKINYSPIKKLVKSAGGLFDGLSKNKGNDEINYLYGFIRKSRSSYQEMNLELQDSLLATKYYFIKNLVNGYPYTRDEQKDMLRRTSMTFCGTYFFTVIFHIHTKEAGAATAKITDFISAFSLEDITGYAANLYEDNIVGVYSCLHEDTVRIKRQIEMLRQETGNTFSIMLTAGMGGLKASLSQTASSFLEASTALDFRLIAGKNKLILFSELKINTYLEIDYPKNSIDNVCQSIKNGRKDALITTLKELFSSIKQNTYSMYIARLLCYDVTNSIIKVLQEMAERNTDFQLPNLIALTNFETVEDLEQVLQRFCETACDYAGSLKPPSLSEKAMIYISQNFANPDFSVGSISQHLGISASYLSHTFKEQQSVTLNDYIKFYKIAVAKKMLTETDDSLEKIIHLLGFYDSSSFIRMFKRSEGITPGEYRKKQEPAIR